MAKKSDQDAFKAWAEQVSSRLPEDKKKVFEQVIGDDTLQKEVFSGFMGEKFLYTRLNEMKQREDQLQVEHARLAAEAGQLKGWWDGARPEYDAALAQKAAYEKYLEELGVDPELALKGEKVPVKTRERETGQSDELSERLDRMDNNLPPLLGAMGRIIQRSLREGLDVDPQEILKYSIQNGVDPYRAFEELTFEQRRTKADEARKAELDKVEKDALERGRREALAQTQTLDHVRPSGPTIFDQLTGTTEKPKSANQRVDSAVQHFRELNAAG